MALRDVLAKFAVNVDSKGLDQAEKGLGKALGAAKKFGAYLVAGFAGNAAVDFVRSQIDIADKLNDTANMLGVATDDLERWQYVAQMGGSSGEAMAKSMGFLNKALGAVADGSKEVIGVFAKLGVETKNADGTARELGDVLPDIVENWNKLDSQGEKTAAAMKLFGKAGAELIPLLNEGGEAAAKAMADFESLGGATPQEMIEQAAEINDEFDRMAFATKKVSMQIVSSLLPSIRWVVTTITHAVSRFREFEKQTGFVRRAIVLLSAGALVLAIRNLVKLAKEAGSASKAIKQIFGLGPQGMAIAVALLVLYLLFDDLFTLIEGGDSVLGKLLDSLFGVGAAQKYVDDLKAAWESIRTTLLDLGVDIDGISDVFSFLGKAVLAVFAGIVQAITGVIQMVAALASAIVAVAKLAKNGVKVLMTGENMTEDTDKQLAALSRAGTTALSGFDNLGKGFAKPGQAAAAGLFGVMPDGSAKVAPSNVPGVPAGWSAAPQVPGNTTVDQKNNVTNNFYGVGDKVGEAVKGALGDSFGLQLKDAKAALKKGA